MDLNRVNDAASAGELVMYGDASRRVVLKAAGIAKAKAVVITYADDRASSKVLHVIRDDYPDLPVIVRTADDSTIVQLQNDGASEVIPEVLEGKLNACLTDFTNFRGSTKKNYSSNKRV